MEPDTLMEQGGENVLTLSPFEQLPAEIIQQIFLSSLEPNLAKTSRYLNRILSYETVFRVLILFAFFQPDGVSPVETQHFLPAEYSFLSRTERERLQQTILGFKWCNRDRINACMPALCRLTMKQAWHRERDDPYWFRPQPVKPLLGNMFEHEVARMLQDHQPPELRLLPDPRNEEDMRTHFKAYGNPDGSDDCNKDGIKTSIVVWRISHGTYKHDRSRPRDTKLIAGNAAVLAALCIPAKFLRGSPWTEDNFAMLKLLDAPLRFALGTAPAVPEDEEQSTSGHVDDDDDWVTADLIDTSWIDSDVEAALFQGMESAILEGKHDILKKLLSMSGQASEGRRPRHLSNLPTSLLETALTHGQEATPYLNLLLSAFIELDSRYDEPLAAWAGQAKKDNNPLGPWLLEALQQPPGQRQNYTYDTQDTVSAYVEECWRIHGFA